MEKITVEKYHGTSQKTGKEFDCIRLTIGDWSSLVFPKSAFERKYVFGLLDKLGK